MRRLLLFAATFVFLTVGVAMSRARADGLRDVVRTLGIDDSSEVYEKLTFLETDPDSAAKYLVAELKPIRSVVRIPPEQAQEYKSEVHVIWCIRALRYLFGIEFTARTRHKFKPDEKERLSEIRFGGGEFAFFGVRMSHDVIYIAPVDTQVEIIREWNDWCAKTSHKVTSDRMKDFLDWYF